MFDGFGGWYKPQISYAIKKSYKSKSELIKIENITNEWNSFGSIDKFVNSKSRLKKITIQILCSIIFLIDGMI